MRPDTSNFADAREAKEFLVGCIIAEAELEGIELSEVERKMMYFSETGWAPPDYMEVNEVFQRECNEAAHELKIALLIRALWERTMEGDPELYRRWQEAVSVLKKEDHYLMVMVNDARLHLHTGYSWWTSDSWWMDKLKLIGTAVLVLLVIGAGAALLQWITS